MDPASVTDWHGWEWHGWDALVAIGTLLLAVMTFVLALTTRSLAKKTAGVAEQTAAVAAETRDLARETARTADADQRALAASMAPLLIDHGTASLDQAPQKTTIGVRSVGPGAAVITSPRPLLRVDADTFWTQGTTPRLVVPSGDAASLVFELPAMPRERAVAQVAYEDIAGGQYRRTRLLILRDANGFWKVEGFALYESSALVKPTVISGPWRADERGAV